MLVTLPGISTLVNSWQPKNATLPMLVKLLDIFTLVMLLQ